MYIYINEREALAIAMIRLNRVISNKRAKEFIDGSVRLVPQPLRLRGKVTWDANIPIINGQHGSEACCWEDPAGLQDCKPSNTTAFFTCPNSKCGKVTPNNSPRFQRNDLDVRITCRFCKRRSPASLWRCPCDVKWHRCLTHGGGCCMRMRNKAGHISKNTKAKTPKAPKRTYDQSYEDLLEEELRRKKSRTTPPTPAYSGSRGGSALPTVLGPIMLARFGHLYEVNRGT